MSTPEVTEEEKAGTPACYRHPKRETYVRCTRCDRYICPDCMRAAAVGHQCVECVREGNRTVRQARTVFGARVHGTPAATYVLVAANVLAYLAELARPGIVGRFDGLGTGLAHGGRYFVADGHAYPGLHPVGIAHGEWYRLITSAFLHLLPTQGLFGITHIVFNMAWLLMLGRAVEGTLGRVRFVALYLVSALGGSVLAYLIAPHQGSLGASGAIFGLAAAYFVISRRLRTDPAGASRLLGMFLVWMVISAGISSWEGHLGGLLAGGAVTAAYAYAPKRHRGLVQAGAVAGVVIVLLALTAAQTASLTA